MKNLAVSEFLGTFFQNFQNSANFTIDLKQKHLTSPPVLQTEKLIFIPVIMVLDINTAFLGIDDLVTIIVLFQYSNRDKLR